MIDLHLIRPELLWLLIPVLPLVFIAMRRSAQAGDWKQAIDPELLQHLVSDSPTLVAGPADSNSCRLGTQP